MSLIDSSPSVKLLAVEEAICLKTTVSKSTFWNNCCCVDGLSFSETCNDIASLSSSCRCIIFKSS